MLMSRLSPTWPSHSNSASPWEQTPTTVSICSEPTYCSQGWYPPLEEQLFLTLHVHSLLWTNNPGHAYIFGRFDGRHLLER
jgi:hypothetical protein